MSDLEPVRILGISGSLRRGSYNTALLRAAVEIAAEQKLEAAFTIADIREIPPYDEDVRAAGLPPAVQVFREAIAKADAILFVTPEYNFSMPGVLKNAIDWGSRPPNQPFADKPFAVMGASGGMGGTMRAQYHLRQSAVFLDMHAVNKPEIFVRNAKDVFEDQQGQLRLKDETVRKLVAELVRSLVKWTRRLRNS
jgi:chromate reductase